MNTLADALVITKRNLLRIPRNPDLLLGFTIQPIMFVLLFRYVFGGAIQPPGLDYVDFLMPGIIVQTMSFGGFVTALSLSDDLNKGLIDRFRSLPMSRSAVLAGRTFADIITNVISLTIMIVVGVIVGFGFGAPVLHVIAGLLILLLFGFAFSWVFAFLGLYSSSPEAAQSLGFVVIFPLTFASSAFVPTQTMPDWLRWFADHNPFSIVVNAVRHLFVGGPAAPPYNSVIGALAWSIGIIVVFAPLAVSRYRRAVST